MLTKKIPILGINNPQDIPKIKIAKKSLVILKIKSPNPSDENTEIPKVPNPGIKIRGG